MDHPPHGPEARNYTQNGDFVSRFCTWFGGDVLIRQTDKYGQAFISFGIQIDLF